MIEIFQDAATSQVRIRYTQLEIRATGVIDIPGPAQLSIDEAGNYGSIAPRMIAHLRDAVAIDDSGAHSMPDGIYEVTGGGMTRLGPLMSHQSLREPLMMLEQPLEVPADASEIAS